MNGQPVSALEKTDYIDTNRPSFMFSPLTVPRSSVQLENGTLYQHFQHGFNTFDIPETQVRLGLLRNTEFQVFVPNYILFHDDGHTHSGNSGLNEIGIKQHFHPTEKIDFSMIASLNVPLGRREFNGRGVQPVFRLPWSYYLGKQWSLMGMQSLLVFDRGSIVQYQPTGMLNKAWGPRLNTFAEYAGFFTQEFPPINIAHFGSTYKITRHNQVDLHFGVGLNKTAPAAFIGGGYSYRFDGLKW